MSGEVTEITSRDSLEPVLVDNDLISVVNDCNVAAAAGKQFVLFKEHDTDSPVALFTQNIIKMREVQDALKPF